LKISVVVATYNRGALLARTLPTLLSQEFPVDEYEVIVVVDGSTDNTRELLKRFHADCALRVIEQANRGPSVARNVGLRAASGDVILFLDDDLVCDHTLLWQHAVSHEQRPTGVVAGQVLSLSESVQSLSSERDRENTARYVERVSQQIEPRWPEDAIIFANCSVSRDLLLAVGGFDERFFFGLEDVELGLRLWKRGARFAFCPAAITYHIYEKTKETLLRRDAPLYGRNELLLCDQHPEYRPHSQLAAVFGGSGLKGYTRRRMIHRHQMMAVGLSVVLRAAEAACSISRMRRFSVRLLNLIYDLSMLESAVQYAGSMAALQNRFGVRLPALLYHRVGNPLAGTYRDLTVRPKRFASRIEWLASRGYVGMRASDWVEWYKTGKQLPAKPVLITIDDGYADLCDYALPILRRFGFSAVVYVVTGYVGDSNRWDQAAGSAALPLMSVEQIRYWAAQGMEFGCHTRTYPVLTALDHREIQREIDGSREDLQQILGVRPASFAFPYGTYSEESTQEALRSFDLLVTCDEGINQLFGTPRMLKRSMVHCDDSLLDVGCRTLLGWNPLERARARIRLRSRLKRLFGGNTQYSPYFPPGAPRHR